MSHPNVSRDREEIPPPAEEEILYASQTAPVVLNDGRALPRQRLPASTRAPGELPTKVQSILTERIVDKRSKMREKICFILTVYPRLSQSMLHTGIGPGTAHHAWRPVVDDMLRDGTLQKIDLGLNTHLGQYRPFTIYRLNDQVFNNLRDRYMLPALTEEPFVAPGDPNSFAELDPIEVDGLTDEEEAGFMDEPVSEEEYEKVREGTSAAGLEEDEDEKDPILLEE